MILIRRFIVVLIFTSIWIIFVESLSPVFIAVGIAASVACLYFSKVYLPLGKIDDINFAKLIFYPFYMIWQIYAGGIYVIKIILAGQRVDFVEVNTEIKSETLRVILADSITLTPGSILIELTDSRILIVWLRKKSDPNPELVTNKDEIIKGHLERKLIKAQKQKLSHRT